MIHFILHVVKGHKANSHGVDDPNKVLAHAFTSAFDNFGEASFNNNKNEKVIMLLPYVQTMSERKGVLLKNRRRRRAAAKPSFVTLPYVQILSERKGVLPAGRAAKPSFHGTWNIPKLRPEQTISPPAPGPILRDLFGVPRYV